MNTGMTPVVYFPFLVAWPHGILYRLGIPMIWEVILAICFLFGSFAAAIHLFCYRHAVILPVGYPTRRSDTFYLFFRPSLYIIYVVVMPPAILYLSPDQVKFKMDIIEHYSCAPTDLLDSKVYGFVSQEDTRIWFFLAFSGIGFLLSSSFFLCAFCVFDSFRFLNNRAKSHMLSERTRQLQHTFLVALLLQICIPLFLYFLPVALMIIGYSLDYFNQSERIKSFFPTFGCLKGLKIEIRDFEFTI